MFQGIFKTKSLNAILESAEAPQASLARTLGPVQLTLLGIGAIIGAGIFSTVGTAVAGSPEWPVSGYPGAGPAIIISFLMTAIACSFAGLCYAEFASMVPVSGSAYTYAYATLGELIGWIIGWDLIIEYAVGNVAVAISWSGYFQQLLAGFGVHMPPWLGTDYRSASQAVIDAAPHPFGVPFVFNLPACAIVVLITWVLVRGIRESAWLNSAMVVLKLLIIAFFLVMGSFYVKPENWHPFAPNGFAGISAAAAILFFAYIGFDAVSTAAEECKKPQRDMPIAIMGSLIVCTIIYILVGIVLCGLLPWKELGTAEPLATAFSGLGMNWTAGVISLGAVFATTSVLVVFQLGQPRIFFSMARDGLLPQWAARVHPKYRTPHITTILTGIFVAVFAGLANIDEVVQLTNIGTLFAFVLVCIGITVLRYKDPDRPRSFRVPLGAWLIPVCGTASCIFLMVYLPPASWWRFIGWLVLGMAVYFAYSYHHSLVGRAAGRRNRADLPQQLAALGFLVLASGLFVLPHALGPVALVDATRDALHADHARALWGLSLSAVGTVLALIGAAISGASAAGSRR